MSKLYLKDENEEYKELNAVPEELIVESSDCSEEYFKLTEGSCSFEFEADINKKIYEELLKPLKTKKDKFEEKIYNKRKFRNFIKNV